MCSSKGCSVSVCVLCTSCLLLGCQLREFSGAVRGAHYSISLLGSFSGLLDALGGGGQGIPVRCFIRFALPCPAASCMGKPTMVVVAVQGPPKPNNCKLGAPTSDEREARRACMPVKYYQGRPKIA